MTCSKVGAGDTATYPDATHADFSEYSRAVAAEPVTLIIRRPLEPLTASEEAAIRAWLALIEETDPAIIAGVLARCQSDARARAYCLLQARELPPPDYTATCGACRHFQRIDHPNLGHCAQGEPEAPAGLWDTDRRWCEKFEAIKPLMP